jgi:hypothetical protein
MHYQYKRGNHYASRGRPKAVETTEPKRGKTLQTLKIVEFTKEVDSFKDKAGITNVKFVASYNWISNATEQPTILVPGM